MSTGTAAPTPRSSAATAAPSGTATGTASTRSRRSGVDKREYHSPRRADPAGDERKPLLGGGAGDARSRDASTAGRSTAGGSLFEQVAEGVQEQDMKRLRREVVRYGGFFWAVVNCLCAGSITAFSLYGPLFLSHLRYTQLQVNLVSITAELGMYLPVPLFGLLCDRIGPGWCSLLSGGFFGFGYLLAAFTYRSGPPSASHGNGWPFWVMILAFIGVGMGTSCMYLSAVTTSAKNFGRGRYKGVALAVPIAALGLSGMWLSLVGDRFFSPSRGHVPGDLDAYRFFLFLGLLLLCVGVVGTFTLRIVDEDVMIDTAIEELEQSGLIQEDDYFRRASVDHGYGTVAPQNLSDSTYDFLRSEAENMKAKAEQDRLRKDWLLNAETRHFLQDRTMWLLAAGFFLVAGPGEAFINNLGTIIGTLYPPAGTSDGHRTTASTHVSIVAVTSTLARILMGTLSDVLAPASESPVPSSRRGPQSLASSLATLEDLSQRRFTLSRVALLLIFSLLCSAGQILLASGAVQDHGERFTVVSALIGSGYGAIFSLVPIVISVVWGVENFGTNWGVVAMVPAGGAAVWGVVYSAVYDAGAERGHGLDGLCYGTRCYAGTFWAMAASVWIACGFWLWAWKGPGGWTRRSVAV